MPRPTRPTLATLDADALARELAPEIEAHRRALDAFAPSTLAALARYARGEVRDPDHDAPSALVDLRLALLLPAVDVPFGDGTDPSHPLELLVVAIGARIALDRRQPITVRQLAVLAGVSATYVYRLVQQGDLPKSDGLIPWTAAARFLAQRKAGAAARTAEETT